MNKLLSIALATALGTVSAQAADLVIEEPAMMPVETSSIDVYIQLLGGVELGTDYVFSDDGDEFDDPVDLGPAVAATIGVVVMDGLSVELDGLYTHRVWTDDEDAYIASLSLMGNLKYTLDVTDSVSIYGAAGIGYIHYSDLCCDAEEAGEFGGFGYQLIAGAGLDVTDSITAIAEVRYQRTFEPAEYLDGDGPFTLDVPTVSVLAGIKLGF